ncbi:MAG: hydantoinase/oxoprolinase family protein [bacterium]|nr:hydantoinase/oxoprolinase family protein [bacterium]
MHLRVGIDTGGTFTDLVAYDRETGRLLSSKSASTHNAPIESFRETFRLAGLEPGQIGELIHGTTIATNALIERRGANVAFVTTAGFEDMPYIQRINRRELYNLGWVKSAPLVGSRNHCFGIRERITADGSVLLALDEAEVEALCEEIRGQGFEAVALCLLFSFLNPVHERTIREIFERKLEGIPFSISCEVAPIWREYERASTTIADAYLKPLVGRYIRALDGGLKADGLETPWAVMKSNGGVVAAAVSAENPIQLAMSGPAGGMITCQVIAQALELDRVATLDMGGTSCDVGLIVDGEQRLTTEYEIEFGLPASIPLIDVKTIGAGGGSIAWVDAGGFLQVGPQSAGASPGPACYGLGGEAPTVTDANLYLGRLDPTFFLDGRMALSGKLAKSALAGVSQNLEMDTETLASSILQIAEDNMANAIRMVSIAQGYDPRDFTLIAFGGAGPLHATAIAKKLDMPRVAIPVVPGNASAFGFLLADARVDKVWTRAQRSDAVDVDEMNAQFGRMRSEVVMELKEGGYTGTPVISNVIHMRYLGQNYGQDVSVPPGHITEDVLVGALGSFHEMHEALYGYAFREAVIELISFQVTAIGPAEKPTLEMLRPPVEAGSPGQRSVFFPGDGWVDATICTRSSLAPGAKLEGPAVVQEAGSTTVLRTGDRMRVDERGILLIDVG